MIDGLISWCGFFVFVGLIIFGVAYGFPGLTTEKPNELNNDLLLRRVLFFTAYLTFVIVLFTNASWWIGCLTYAVTFIILYYFIAPLQLFSFIGVRKDPKPQSRRTVLQQRNPQANQIGRSTHFTISRIGITDTNTTSSPREHWLQELSETLSRSLSRSLSPTNLSPNPSHVLSPAITWEIIEDGQHPQLTQHLHDIINSLGAEQVQNIEVPIAEPHQSNKNNIADSNDDPLLDNSKEEKDAYHPDPRLICA